jgi:quercetin dioxygenase-like cupin family protein
MTTKTRILIAAVAVAGIIVTITRATPTVGQFFTVLSSSSTDEEIMQHVRVPIPEVVGANSEDKEDEWIAKLYTSGPSTFQVVDVTLTPSGHTGWHSHPGILLISVISGSIEWYNSQCMKHVYNAGDSLTESTEIHDVRNVGTVNAHFMVTYVIAKGQPRRIDQPAPACAASLGLE